MWKFISLLVFSILLISTRLLGSSDSWWLYNVSPFIALFFCGSFYKERSTWLLPLVAVVWVLTNPISSMMQGFSPWHTSLWVTLLAFTVIVCSASAFRKTFGTPKSAGVMLLCATLAACWFYFLTNSASFFLSSSYAKTWQGYTQAMWFGLPEFQVPTWVFFRNSLCSTVSVSMLFYWAMQPVRTKQKEEIRLASVPEKR